MQCKTLAGNTVCDSIARSFTHLPEQRHRDVHALAALFIGAWQEIPPPQGQYLLAQQQALPANGLQEQRAQTAPDLADDGLPRIDSSHTPIRLRSRRAVSCSRRDKPISSNQSAVELLIQASDSRVV